MNINILKRDRERERERGKWGREVNCKAEINALKVSGDNKNAIQLALLLWHDLCVAIHIGIFYSRKQIHYEMKIILF